jgi:hypothetical protein
VGKVPLRPPARTLGFSLRISDLILVATALVLSSSCAGEVPESATAGVISREAFIEAYVELRVEALKSDDQEIPLEARDRILGGLGLTEEDLLQFVDRRGRDVQFMRRVWEEVDSIMTSRRGLPDTPDRRGSP